MPPPPSPFRAPLSPKPEEIYIAIFDYMPKVSPPPQPPCASRNNPWLQKKECNPDDRTYSDAIRKRTTSTRARGQAVMRSRRSGLVHISRRPIVGDRDRPPVGVTLVSPVSPFFLPLFFFRGTRAPPGLNLGVMV